MAEVPQGLKVEIHHIARDREHIDKLFSLVEQYRLIPTPEGKEKLKVYSLLLVKALSIYYTVTRDIICTGKHQQPS